MEPALIIFFARNRGFEPGHGWMDGCNFCVTYGLRCEAREISTFAQTAAVSFDFLSRVRGKEL
jgi:hypothetical protein